MVVIAEDETAARAALDKAKKIYGGHMGGALEEHGIWGSPEGVIERIERHRALGVSGFVIEFFGRDTREPARLFAKKVMPAFALGSRIDAERGESDTKLRIGARLPIIRRFVLGRSTRVRLGDPRARARGSTPGPGCDPSRPAVAHHAGGVALDPQPANGPIACGVYTGFPGGETRIETGQCGTLMYAPAVGDPRRRAADDDLRRAAGWRSARTRAPPGERKLPFGVTWHQNDLETYVDRETGKLFFGVMFANPPGQIPTDSQGNPGSRRAAVVGRQHLAFAHPRLRPTRERAGPTAKRVARS